MRASSVLVLCVLSLTSAIPIDPLASVAAVGTAVNKLEHMNPPAIQLGGKRNQVPEEVADPLEKRKPQDPSAIVGQLLPIIAGLASNAASGSLKRNPNQVPEVATEPIVKRKPQDPSAIVGKLLPIVASFASNAASGSLKRNPQDPAQILNLTTGVLSTVGGVGDGILNMKRDSDTKLQETMTNGANKGQDTVSLLLGLLTQLLSVVTSLLGSLVGGAGSLPVSAVPAAASAPTALPAIASAPTALANIANRSANTIQLRNRFTSSTKKRMPVEPETLAKRVVSDADLNGDLSGAKETRQSTGGSPPDSDSDTDGALLTDEPEFTPPANDGIPAETDAETVAQGLEATFEGVAENAISGRSSISVSEKREAQGDFEFTPPPNDGVPAETDAETVAQGLEATFEGVAENALSGRGPSPVPEKRQLPATDILGKVTSLVPVVQGLGSTSL